LSSSSSSSSTIVLGVSVLREHHERVSILRRIFSARDRGEKARQKSDFKKRSENDDDDDDDDIDGRPFGC
jgi:hypothetical protein